MENNNIDLNDIDNETNGRTNKEVNDSVKIKSKLGIEDQVFPATFSILKGGGVWASTAIKFSVVHFGYQIYSFLSVTSVMWLIISVILGKYFPNPGTESTLSITEYWYMIAIWSNATMKATNIILKKKKIVSTLENYIMDERWSNLRDDEEKSIIKSSRFWEKTISLLWLSMILGNGVSSTMYPIVSENPDNNLIFECYLPCDKRNATCYWISFTYQTFGYMQSSFIHVGCDSLIFNFIERISSHIKLFQHRLDILPKLIQEKMNKNSYTTQFEDDYLKKCIKDHQSIYKSVNEVNDLFYEIVCVQFVTSITTLCTNIYFLSKQELFSPDFIAVFAFLCCVFTQNFFYCWYGHKITENNNEVIDTICYMDWLTCRKESRKMLLFIMLSASRDVQLFSNAIVELSPEMFLKLLKVSYSSFNLLQQSNKKDVE